MNKFRLTASERSLGEGVKHAGTAIIVLGVLYSDIMFVSLMWSAFPEGFLRILALGGAFVTGLSIIALYVGKSHWFRPGGQVNFAWAFTVAELMISIMNVIVSVIVARHGDLGYLSYWLLLAPGTPFVGVVGWILIAYLDPLRKERHDRMEMEDDLHAADLEYERASHDAALRIKHQALKIHEGYMAQELDSAERQAQIAQAASNLTSDVLAQLSGGYIPRRVIQQPHFRPQLQQPTQHVPAAPSSERVFQEPTTGGESADPLVLRMWQAVTGQNGNGAKPPAQE